MPKSNVFPLDQARQARAKRAEIAKRYGRESPVKRALILSLRRADLDRLFKHRDEVEAPSRDEAIARLRLLLEIGLPGIDAHKRAPWLQDGELERLISDANANAAYWGNSDATHSIADKIGERVELTFAEFRACGGFRFVAPCDAQPYEVREFRDARRRERDAERKRRSRETGKKHWARRWSPRARAVLEFLDKNTESFVWERTEDVAAGVRASPAFKGLTRGGAMRLALKRIFDKLAAAGEIEKHMARSNYRGSFEYRTLFVHRVPGKR